MNIKRNPISARDMCSFLLSPPLFKGGIVIASARLSVCSFVRLSFVCYAPSSLTIGRNPTKFDVRNFHMSGLCDSTLLGPSPWGPGEGSKVFYHI